MSIGTGKFVRQFGGFGVFAIVKVEANPGTLGLSVTVDPTATADSGASEYAAAATVGVRYAWEQLNPYQRGDGALVRVLEITPLTVDTTEIAMVYAAALALWDALQLPPERPLALDSQARTMSFPV